MGTHPIFESDFDCLTDKCMEGVGLVSIEGHPLLVRTLSGEFPTTYLLTLFSSEKFAKEQSDCTIILSESDTKKIGWRKKFEFILIGWFCKETNDDLVCRLLSYAEDVLMMFMGQEDLESLDQASKRDLRLCYPILDSLLTSVDDIPPFIVVEYPIKPINSISNLDVQLNQWAEEIETPYAAIVDGNVLVQATPDFEESLAHEEINLIIQIVKLSSSAAVLEIPVYMPRSFPNAAHRLIIVRLFDEVTAIGLCGVNPPLSKVFLNPPFVAFNDQLRSRRTTPRELLHSSLLGFIVQDIPAKKSAFYIHPRKMSVMEDEMNKVEISQSLLNIYQKSKQAAYSPHSEYYAVRKEFKAYVLKEDGRHMVFLFAPEVPIFALKEIAQQSANQLVNIRL